MKKMSKEERKEIEFYITKTLADATGWDYAKYILNSKDEETECTVMENVIDDIMFASAWGYDGDYSDDDIRLAIGRVLMERMEITY